MWFNGNDSRSCESDLNSFPFSPKQIKYPSNSAIFQYPQVLVRCSPFCTKMPLVDPINVLYDCKSYTVYEIVYFIVIKT